MLVDIVVVAVEAFAVAIVAVVTAALESVEEGLDQGAELGLVVVVFVVEGREVVENERRVVFAFGCVIVLVSVLVIVLALKASILSVLVVLQLDEIRFVLMISWHSNVVSHELGGMVVLVLVVSHRCLIAQHVWLIDHLDYLVHLDRLDRLDCLDCLDCLDRLDRLASHVHPDLHAHAHVHEHLRPFLGV